MSVIGIDLGTTYSCVGAFRHDHVEIFANDMGNRTTPSCVSFTEDEYLIGDPAKNQAVLNPTNTIFNVKRMIGRKFSDPIVQTDLKNWPFMVIQGDGDRPKIQVQYKGNTKEFLPEEISAMILRKMKDIAETCLSEKITDAVITVPVYFNDSQRQATKDAGSISGLNILRIINEPTAAALAFGLNKKSDFERHILVFDLGGGTFDVSILVVDDGIFEVRASGGDPHLGGEDFDSRMVDFFADRFQTKYKCDLRESPRALRTLRAACERAKRTLSTASSASIMCDSIFQGHDLSDNISRAIFENLNDELFRSCIYLVAQVLNGANMNKSDITDIVLVGGSSRIPRVQQLLREFFNGKLPVHGIDPDEAIAYGAAFQADIIKGYNHKADNLIFYGDYIPLSLGIETDGGIMTVVLPRNSTIPVKKSITITTESENQSEITIKVFEGERSRTHDNNLLDTFKLQGIPPAPRGDPQIEVTFYVNADGFLNVSAQEKSTGIFNNITIKNDKGYLSQAEVNQIIKDAEKFKEEDRKLIRRIESKNCLECYIFRVHKTINDVPSGDIDALDRNSIIEIIKEGLEWIESNQDASVETFEFKQKEIEGKIISIMQNYFLDSTSNKPGGIDLSTFSSIQCGEQISSQCSSSGYQQYEID